MRTKLKGLIREEAGAALVLTLVLLLIGGLIIAPLLGHMGTGHTAGQVHEKRMDELYAADAGVERAIWQIANDPSAGVAPFIVNEKDVEVDTSMVACREYAITSEATTPGASATKVEAFIYGFSFPDNAITSRGDVELGNRAYVEGRIQYGEQLKPHNNAEYDPENTLHERYGNWPNSDQLYSYYYGKHVQNEMWAQVYDHGHTISDLGTEHAPLVIGPANGLGDLTITGDGWVELDGTIYVQGDLTINPSPAIHLELNGHTIFAEGGIEILPGVTVTGPGSLIAVGDIGFQPNMDTADYVLVLSLKGSVRFQPGNEFYGFVMSVEEHVEFRPRGTFYGSVAGDVNVDLDARVTIIYRPDLQDHVDFPFEGVANWRILSYNIYTETG